MKKTEKTLASIVFHGPVDDRACRREVTRLARRHGGKFSYLSFWYARRNCWHSEAMTGKAAFSVRVPIAAYRAAVQDARKLVVPGLTYSHRWSHYS